MTKTEKKKQYEDKLRQFSDFNAVLGAADAGMIGDAVSTITEATTDFQTDADERSREAKASANTLRTLAKFFAVKHDDTLNEHGEDDDAEADMGFLDIDDMRDNLVQKLWIYHDIITARLFPGDTAEDARGRRSGGNNINIILKRYFEPRRARLSPHTKDDPIYEPPTKTDFITSTKLPTKERRQAKNGVMPGEAPAANSNAIASQLPPAPAEQERHDHDAAPSAGVVAGSGANNAAITGSGRKRRQSSNEHPYSSGTTEGHDHVAAVEEIINSSEARAIAMERENERLMEVQRAQKEKVDKLLEQEKNLIAIREMQKKKRAQKKIKEAQRVAKEATERVEELQREIEQAETESAAPPQCGSPVGGQVSPAAAAAIQPVIPSTSTTMQQPDFSKLIHSLEIDAVRRNVVGVRPQQPFQQYDPKQKGEYNSLMNTFDSAFGCIQGITGNEKVTELSGHWFAGAAKKAINAAKPTSDDLNGDAAYAKVRLHLDSIYGQDIDSAADALARLKEGGVISEKSLTAHHDLYMNMLEAKSAASAASHSELLNRRTSLLEIINARMPFYAEKFFEQYEQGDGFQELLDFILTRINVLKIIQSSTKPQTTETEKKISHQHHHHITDHQTQPPFQGCMYCKNHHDTSRCDKLYCLSLEDRVAAISILHLCYHCLRPGHNAKSCPDKREVTCSICNRKGHVTLLHGRHLLHSPNDSSNRHRRYDDDDKDANPVKLNEYNEAEEENENDGDQ